MTALATRMSAAALQARRARLGWALSRRLTPYLFLAPSFAALMLVSFFPMAHAVGLSFYSDSARIGHFVGLEHYATVLSSDYFPQMIRTSILWTAGNVVFVWAIGLGTALILDGQFPGRRITRALFILPWAMPYVAAGLIWGWMFDFEFGVLNYLLHGSGLTQAKLGFLIACPDALASLTGVSVWKLFPLGTVMFLAGLQTIPPEHYEAATVDGAGPIQSFRHVTLPGLRNVSIMLILLVTLWTFGRAFTIIFLLTEGGPAGCTETIVIRSYLEAFKFFHIGTASAIGVIVLILSLAFSIAYLAVAYRNEAERA